MSTTGSARPASSRRRHRSQRRLGRPRGERTGYGQRNGFIGGGQVGYNYQFGNSFLIGLEADLQGAGIRSDNSFVGASSWNAFNIGPGVVRLDRSAASATTVTSFRTDWLGTVPRPLAATSGDRRFLDLRHRRSRLWRHAGDDASVLFYEQHAFRASPALSVSVPYGSIGGFTRYDQSRVGWTVGGGIEWLFAPNLNFKAEFSTTISAPLVI